jgi:hypothetical protein
MKHLKKLNKKIARQSKPIHKPKYYDIEFHPEPKKDAVDTSKLEAFYEENNPQRHFIVNHLKMRLMFVLNDKEGQSIFVEPNFKGQTSVICLDPLVCQSHYPEIYKLYKHLTHLDDNMKRIKANEAERLRSLNSFIQEIELYLTQNEGKENAA